MAGGAGGGADEAAEVGGAPSESSRRLTLGARVGTCPRTARWGSHAVAIARTIERKLHAVGLDPSLVGVPLGAEVDGVADILPKLTRQAYTSANSLPLPRRQCFVGGTRNAGRPAAGPAKCSCKTWPEATKSSLVGRRGALSRAFSAPVRPSTRESLRSGMMREACPCVRPTAGPGWGPCGTRLRGQGKGKSDATGRYGTLRDAFPRVRLAVGRLRDPCGTCPGWPGQGEIAPAGRLPRLAYILL